MTKATNKLAKETLVIAYGNPLRSDDGVAWQAAEQLRRELPVSAQIVCVHQLTPELAEAASRAETVVFLDAARNGDPGTVRCDAVLPGPSDIRFSHHLTPAEVMTLCRDLYSAKPRAFLVSVNGQNFAHGEKLSSAVIKAIPEIVAKVSGVVRRMTVASQENFAEMAAI